MPSGVSLQVSYAPTHTLPPMQAQSGVPLHSLGSFTQCTSGPSMVALVIHTSSLPHWMQLPTVWHSLVTAHGPQQPLPS